MRPNETTIFTLQKWYSPSFTICQAQNLSKHNAKECFYFSLKFAYISD